MTLREDAQAIWQAGVDAVDSVRLVENAISLRQNQLNICSETMPLDKIERIEIVGAGKAGTGMATGVLRALQELPETVAIGGWVNVPEDCVRSIGAVHLHAARPAGVNEPTPAGVAGTQEILSRVSTLGSCDLCLVLISGGGSALLPAPVPDVSLEEKLTVTRLLAGCGATIQELNVVRSQLSAVKGGGLLRHCNAGHVVALIISDVIGDPIDLIASGPTQPSLHRSSDAMDILKRYDPTGESVPSAVKRFLESNHGSVESLESRCRNYVVGSNSVALAASAVEAQKRGYEVENLGAENEGEARELGRSLFQRLKNHREGSTRDSPPLCLLAGGETTVTLAKTDCERKGGRNQEVVLGAIADQPHPEAWENVVLLSGGTDGEDGPTDAAGAVADEGLLMAMQREGVDAVRYLEINNSYPYFVRFNGLIQTGPTHTNVMDLAVGLVGT